MPIFIFSAFLGKLCWVKITAALNINRSSDLVGTTVSSWIVLSQLLLVFVFEIGQNGINIFSLPIVHVIGELFLSLLKIKGLTSTEFKEETVIMPRIVRYLGGYNPIFESYPTFMLIVIKVSEMA